MEDLIFKFIEVAEEIRSHSKMKLLNFGVGDGLSADEISALEELHQVALPSDIKDFYLNANGLQLRWIHVDSPRYEEDAVSSESEHFDIFDFWEDKIPYTGCVNILPLHEMLGHDWRGFVWNEKDKDKTLNFLNSKENALEFRRGLRIFDLVGPGRGSAFYIPPDESRWLVLNSSDDFLDFNWSRPTDFSSYLEFLLVTKASLQSRIAYYLNLDLKMEIVSTSSSTLDPKFIPNWENFSE